MIPPADQEMENYPHVFFTSDMPWDPSILESDFSAKEILLHEDEPMTPYYYPSNLKNYGEIIKYQAIFHEISEIAHDTYVLSTFYSSPHLVRPNTETL